ARPHSRTEDRRLVHGEKDRDRRADHRAEARRHQPRLRSDGERRIDPQRRRILIRVGVSELQAFVGRQAIFDRRLEVVGYELLFRNSEENRARFSDANQATAATMLNAYVELGLDALAPPVPVWVNLPADFFL